MSPESLRAPFDRRRAGVLLHPTSFPDRRIGADAYRFVDWLAASGFTLWQVLPLGPPDKFGSPYQARSAFAGCADLLPALSDTSIDAVDYAAFYARHAHWLMDYALYEALAGAHDGAPWQVWPEAIRQREPPALAMAHARHAQTIQAFCVQQYGFFRAWQHLRDYAHARGIHVIGDLPIFVAHDCADVWAQPDYFRLDEHGMPAVVAGVPPDYFSATGQRWGNPLYNWPRHQHDGFAWWRRRMMTLLDLYDAVRIDHFRGFEACWVIPAPAETAAEGYWEAAPGTALLAALQAECGAPLPCIAEDLGVITPEVTALREHFGLPGMRVLQFAYDGNADNPHLPVHHTPDIVAYTGTHDNNTTRGWYQALDAVQQARVLSALGAPSEPMPWSLIDAALASPARSAIIPLQDLLGLDGAHRMNLPGTTQGNWTWRFTWDQVPRGLAARLRVRLARHDRL